MGKLGYCTWSGMHDAWHGMHTVKLANSANLFKFHQVKFPQKTGLENDEMCFS